MTTTYYGVQTFVKKGRGLAAEQPRIATSEAAAVRMAQTLATTKAGAIAFKRIGDMDTGVFDDPIILAEHGDVPSQDGF
ncbi:MAG TPA: hypothetical protein VHL98_10905 [Microvirga sp.]|jgi:hypothetical protein|nr:hypothetical protein [Microvirga sp.]